MSFATGFRHGAPLVNFQYPPMPLELIEALAAWFLVWLPTATQESSAPGFLDSDDPTNGGIKRTIKRSLTGNLSGARCANTPLIFRIVRASRSTSVHVALSGDELGQVFATAALLKRPRSAG